MQRYSNLYVLSNMVQTLQDAGLMTPDGQVRPSSSPRQDTRPPEPFKLSQRLDEATINKIITQYEAGTSSLRLANQFRISKGSVIRVLRDAGVSIRNQSLSEKQIKQATKLYLSGMSLINIGTQLGFDATTVHRQLFRRGVKMRDTHGRER